MCMDHPVLYFQVYYKKTWIFQSLFILSWYKHWWRAMEGKANDIQQSVYKLWRNVLFDEKLILRWKWLASEFNSRQTYTVWADE